MFNVNKKSTGTISKFTRKIYALIITKGTLSNTKIQFCKEKPL